MSLRIQQVRRSRMHLFFVYYVVFMKCNLLNSASAFAPPIGVPLYCHSSSCATTTPITHPANGYDDSALTRTTVTSIMSRRRRQADTSITSTTLFMAKKRKARQNSKADITRPNSKMAIQEKPPIGKKEEENIEDEDTDAAATTATTDQSTSPQSGPKRMSRGEGSTRPDVSTLIVDEESGIEVLQQGQNVMDIVTRKAVVLHPNPDYRLAQMFPGVPDPIRNRHRPNQLWKSVPELIDAFEQAALVTIASTEEEKRDFDHGTTNTTTTTTTTKRRKMIPPHPSIANTALDFVTANRDLMGRNMKLTLGRIHLRHLSMRNVDLAKRYYRIWKHFVMIENYISAPFRQMMLDAEGRVGPNFGNLDLKSYANGPLYERCANYLVLKGMVAHWEKKVLDADFVEKNPQTKDNYMTILNVGDPKRYLPDPPILYTLRECAQVCAMAQQMTKAFVEDSDLFADFPVELRFLEKALTIKGTTPLRQFTIQEFCPQESISPEALREGLRRLMAQLENMQIDPYGDIYNILVGLVSAMAVGTDDIADSLYKDYLGNPDHVNGPGAFQTYTFNHAPLSRVRFLDGQYPSAASREAVTLGRTDVDDDDDLFGIVGRWTGERKDLRSEPVVDKTPYKVPDERALGRPQELGWLELFDNDEEIKAETAIFGQVKPGRIIME